MYLPRTRANYWAGEYKDTALSIAEQESDDGFFAEFLDDYFAESEEHLTDLRRGMLALEPFVHQPQISRPLLDELFRSFHSLKGISGMVGVREAEQLAHQMESYLRALRQGQLRLAPEGMDTLIAGTKMLETVISARRERNPAPDIAPVLARLESMIPDGSPAAQSTSSVSRESAGADGEGQVAGPAKSGARMWSFEFVPTPALA